MAALVSVALTVLFGWWFHPGWAVLLGYAALGIMATASVPAVYRLAGFTLADEVQWLEQRETLEHDEMVARLGELRIELATLNIDAAVQQADTLGAMLDDYHAVIDSRFRGKKHSPVTYLSAARRLQKHAVQNLNDVVAIGHSLVSISRHDESTGSTDDARRQRLDILQDDQQQRLQSLLDENQRLFDALTDTAVEVANIRSFSQFERLETLTHLVSLAEIASHSGPSHKGLGER